MKYDLHTNLYYAVIILTCLGLVSCSDDGDQDRSAEFESFLATSENFLDQGQYRAAIIEARNAIQLRPSDPRGHVELARILIELGQPREAIKGLEALSADSPDYYLALATAYFRSGKLRSASDLLTAHQGILTDRPLETGLLWGNISLAQGDISVAETRFHEVLELDANNVEAKFGLIKSAATRGNPEAAEADLEALLASNPNYAEALLLASSLQAIKGNLERAEELLVTAISSLSSTDVLTPLRYSILSALRNVLNAQGKSNEALIYSRLLVESAPEAQEANQKLQEAITAISEGDLDIGRGLLNEVLEIVPNSDRAGTMLGIVDYLQGNRNAAVEQFEQFVDPETAAPLALQVFTLAQLQLKQPEKVIERLKADIDNMKDAKVVSLYGIALISAGDLQTGEKYLVKSLSLDSENGRLRLPLARLFNIQENNEGALRQVRMAYESSPEDPLIQSSYLAQLITMGRTGKATELTNELTERYPDSQQTQLLIGDYLLGQNDLTAARAKFKQVLKLGESVPARYQLVRINLAEKQYDAAESGLRELIDSNASDAQAYKGLITVYETQGRGTEGVTVVLQYASQGYTDAPKLVLSEYYGLRGEFDKAFEFLDQVSQDNPAFSLLTQQLYLAKANQQLSNRDYDGARTSALEGLNLSPENPELLALLVSVEIAAERVEAATKVLAQLKDIQPGAPIVNLLEGDIAEAKGDLANARSHYESVWEVASSDDLAVKIYQVMRSQASPIDMKVDFLTDWRKKQPNSQLPRLALAGEYMETGEMQKAQTEYEALVTASPNSVVAHNNLAWIYGESNIKLAVAAGKKAYDLAPENGEIIDTYAWFLYKNGELTQAKELIAKAISLSPDNEEIQQHYEEILAK